MLGRLRLHINDFLKNCSEYGEKNSSQWRERGWNLFLPASSSQFLSLSATQYAFNFCFILITQD